LVASSTCYDEDRYVDESILGSSQSYTPTDYLKCLLDNGDSYNWSVRAYDGEEFGPWTTPRNISIQSLITISLPVDNVNFGVMNISDTDDTTDNNPAPLNLRNDGNVNVNVSVNFTNLFSSVSNPSDYFKYKIRNNSVGCYVESGTQTTWKQAPLATEQAINKLNFTSGYQSGCNNVSVDLYVKVPPDEVPGNKSSVITFTSSLADVYPPSDDNNEGGGSPAQPGG